MTELVIDGSDALGVELDLDPTEATAELVIDSDFTGIELDGEES